ncbi:MAG: sporulation protein YtfJ [Clostridia bacterium]|nr:sporulation protein YtfJ [Clostridia bacterium]
MADNTNRLGDLNRASLDSIKSMLDANTIVGDPIETKSGTCIIPISKITVGYASGGLDFAKKDAEQKPNNFGGGGGTGITVAPVAFLVIAPNGEVNMLSVNTSNSQAPADTVTQVVGLIEKSPELIERVKSVFTKKNEDNSI